MNGHNGDDPFDGTDNPERLVRTRPASKIQLRPVVWLWQDRIPAGALTLPAGREGTGKSQFAVWLTARITRGQLDGRRHGTPATVFYAGVEDSWSHTIAPRLVAAGADLDLVRQVYVETYESDDVTLSLPLDLDGLEERIHDYDAAALIFDPLLSMLAHTLDSHRNRDVRQALDPLAKLADRTGCAIVGVAHFNKSSGSDGSSLIVGSGAFKDVARSVLSFARDPETNERVMSQTKNSLGRDGTDLPSLSYVIEPHDVATDEGPAHVSRLVWQGESKRTVADLIRDAGTSPEERGALEDAEEWLTELLADGPVAHAAVLAAAEEASHSKRTLERVKKLLGVRSQKVRASDGSQHWQWLPPAKTAKDAKAAPSGDVGDVGDLARFCDRCGQPSDDLVHRFGEGEDWCADCRAALFDVTSLDDWRH